MTIITKEPITKDDLRQYRRMVEEIKILDSERESIREMAIRTTSGYSLSSGRGGIKRGLDYYVADIADLDELIRAKICAQTRRRRDLEEAVDRLGIEERLAIRYYYFIGLPTWEDVACEMHVSIATVHRIHGAALQKLLS